MIDVTKMMRQLRTSKAWATRGMWSLRQSAETATLEEKWLVGYEANSFVEHIIDAADSVLDLLNVEDLERVEKLTANITTRLRSRRLAAALSNVDGRTEAEAETFKAKAEEMAERS